MKARDNVTMIKLMLSDFIDITVKHYISIDDWVSLLSSNIHYEVGWRTIDLFRLFYAHGSLRNWSILYWAM